MPIYEFECNDCGEIFETVCSVNSGPSACPICKSQKVSKLISPFGIGKPGMKLGKLTPSEQRKAGAAISRSGRRRSRKPV